MSQPNSELVAITVTEDLDPSLAAFAEAESGGESPLVVQSLLDDHSELRQRVVRLRRLCLKLEGNQGPAGPGAAALVEEFAYLLIAHFAAEEASEFFENRLRDRPQMLRRVEGLQTEHGEIAAALGEVLEFAKSKPPGPVLATRVARILDMFDAHERAEKAVIQELVLLDEGGGGE